MQVCLSVASVSKWSGGIWRLLSDQKLFSVLLYSAYKPAFAVRVFNDVML